MDDSELNNDTKRVGKSLSVLTRKFVSLLLSSKNGILDLKLVSKFSFKYFFLTFSFNNLDNLKFCVKEYRFGQIFFFKGFHFIST